MSNLASKLSKAYFMVSMTYMCEAVHAAGHTCDKCNLACTDVLQIVRAGEDATEESWPHSLYICSDCAAQLVMVALSVKEAM
jgi:hypothetical protein